MTPIAQLEDRIREYITLHSGFRTEQAYVGMSSIGTCLRDQYRRYTEPLTAGWSEHANSYRGYHFEQLAKSMLLGAGIYRQDSERTVEWFDTEYERRYLGHTDGETVDSDLLEIKTLRKDKFEKVRADQKLPWREFSQVQMYMTAGRYKRCLVFVLCPETLDYFFLWIHPVANVQQSMLLRARVLMDAIARGTEPKCDCPRCKS